MLKTIRFKWKTFRFILKIFHLNRKCFLLNRTRNATQLIPTAMTCNPSSLTRL